MIVAGSLMFLSVFGNVVQMIILAVVILVGTLLFGIKTSIGSALKNSVVFGFISDYFEIRDGKHVENAIRLDGTGNIYNITIVM